MKTTILAVILMLCAGCAVNTRTVDYTHAWPLQPTPNNELVIVNNSTHGLSVLTDGQLAKDGLKPGEICTIQAWAWRSPEQMVVTVIATEHPLTQSRVYDLYRHGKHADVWTITDDQLRGSVY